MNVSSIVVQTSKEHLNEVIAQINSVGFCEVHFHDPDGKIVATIEGESIKEQTERLKLIQNIPFVFTAGLAYSYCEDELTEAMGVIEGNQPFSQD